MCIYDQKRKFLQGQVIAVCVCVVELLPLRRSNASVLTVGFLQEPPPPTQYRFSNHEQISTKINPSESKSAPLLEIFKSNLDIIPVYSWHNI